MPDGAKEGDTAMDGLRAVIEHACDEERQVIQQWENKTFPIRDWPEPEVVDQIIRDGESRVGVLEWVLEQINAARPPQPAEVALRELVAALRDGQINGLQGNIDWVISTYFLGREPYHPREAEDQAWRIWDALVAADAALKEDTDGRTD